MWILNTISTEQPYPTNQISRNIISYPCLLTRIREFIHTQHRNTTRGRRPSGRNRHCDVPTACTRRRRGALGDLTALLLPCRCEPTAFTRRSFRSPWERRATARTLCMHKVRAVAWRPRRPHGVQWRCHGDATAIPRRSRRSHCAHLGVLSFSCTPCSRRAVATLVWQGLKESGRRSESPLWRHQWRSFVFISHADDVKREIRLHTSRLLTNQKRESARSMG